MARSRSRSPLRGVACGPNAGGVVGGTGDAVVDGNGGGVGSQDRVFSDSLCEDEWENAEDGA